jgi:hypothetical protein
MAADYVLDRERKCPRRRFDKKVRTYILQVVSQVDATQVDTYLCRECFDLVEGFRCTERGTMAK